MRPHRRNIKNLFLWIYVFRNSNSKRDCKDAEVCLICLILSVLIRIQWESQLTVVFERNEAGVHSDCLLATDVSVIHMNNATVAIHTYPM
jgi:hypothetical protein